MKRILSAIATAGILGIGLGFAPRASAALLVENFPGNDCAGVFGTPKENPDPSKPLDTCNPANADEIDPAVTVFKPYDSPLIVKFDFDVVDGEFVITETTPGAFGFIDPTKFSFTFTEFDGNEGTKGTWTYTPGPHHPLIKYYAVKGGNAFNFFGSEDPQDFDPDNDGTYSGTFSTPDGKGVSHISFYNTRAPKVPEPSLLLGIGAVVGSSFLLRRRKSS